MTALLFAFGAGMLSTVNPCGFALLPAFFAYYLGKPAEAGLDGKPAPLVTRVGQGFLVGLAVSVGFAAVFTVVGLLVSLGLRSLVGAVPWAAVVIGGGLVVLGAVFLTGGQVRVRLRHGVGAGHGTGYRGLVAFGAAYAVASLSCTLAVLLAVVAQATATANPLQLMGVFAAYGAGAASILVSLAVAAALAKETLARKIRRLLPVVTRLGGAVLVLSGVYLVLYWLPALTGGPINRSGATAITESLSAGLTGWLSDNQGMVALAAAILAALGAVAALRTRLNMRVTDQEIDHPREDCCTDPRPDGTAMDSNRSR
jgi:cytochrome c-type biogenesis protein